MRKPFLTLSTVLLIGISLPSDSWAASPSFDCSIADEPDEIALCSNDFLAQFDILISSGFEDIKRMKGKKQGNAMAKSFLAERKACYSDYVCIHRVSIAAIIDVAEAGSYISFPPGVRPELVKSVVLERANRPSKTKKLAAKKISPAQVEATEIAATNGDGANGTLVLTAEKKPKASALEILIDPNDINGRFCHSFMGNAQRYDGKPHDLSACKANPESYQASVSFENQRIAQSYKAEGKDLRSLPDGRPFLSRLIVLNSHIEGFRAEDFTMGPELVVSGVDTLDLHTQDLAMLKDKAASQEDQEAVTFVRQNLERTQARALPVLRDALAKTLAQRPNLASTATSADGVNSKRITFTNADFQSKEIVQQVHPAIAPLLLRLRFSTARYDSGLGDGNIYETKLKTPADTAIVRWSQDGTATNVF